MIGLSVSGCIREIAEGKVLEADVEKIIGSTGAESASRWEEVILCYERAVWGGTDGEKICRRLLAAGKIEQPRLTGRIPDIRKSGGYWVNSESEIVWRNF